MTTLTEAQQEKRLGRFTASQVSRLLTAGRRNMTIEELKKEKSEGGKRKTIDTPFGDGSMTYIFEVASERITGTPAKAETSSAATQWGIDHELEAQLYFQAATGKKIIESDTLTNKFMAGTPDGNIEGESCGFEIKCPYNSGIHLKNLFMKNQVDLITMHPDYYWQIMSYMWLAELPEWKFCSYDPRFKGASRMLILNIKREDYQIKLLEERLTEANLILESLVSNFK